MIQGIAFQCYMLSWFTPVEPSDVEQQMDEWFSIEQEAMSSYLEKVNSYKYKEVELSKLTFLDGGLCIEESLAFWNQ